jgi:hypothetical protein
VLTEGLVESYCDVVREKRERFSHR